MRPEFVEESGEGQYAIGEAITIVIPDGEHENDLDFIIESVDLGSAESFATYDEVKTIQVAPLATTMENVGTHTITVVMVDTDGV